MRELTAFIQSEKLWTEKRLTSFAQKEGVLACTDSVELEFKGKTLVMVERGGRSV